MPPEDEFRWTQEMADDLRAFHGIATLPDGSQEPVEMRPPARAQEPVEMNSSWNTGVHNPHSFEGRFTAEGGIIVEPGTVLPPDIPPGIIVLNTENNAYYMRTDQNTWEPLEAAQEPDRNLWDHLQEPVPDKGLWDHLNEDD